MNAFRKLPGACAAFVVCSLAAFGAHADIVLAQVAPFTGPLGSNGEGNYIGAKACIDAVNAQGGVHGVPIRLVREDDTYKPAETERLVRLVAERDKPVAFLNLLGSANVALLLKQKTLEQVGIPAIGVTPGAESLRSPGSPWLFHLQAGDKAQVNAVLTHLSTLGLTKIALVYQDIPFGKSGLSFVEELSPGKGISLLAKVAVPAGANDTQAAAAEIAKSGAQAYLMVLAPNSGAAFVRDARAAGDRTPLYSLSYLSVAEAVYQAGKGGAAGVGIAQISPNPTAPTTRLVREFQAAMAQHAPSGSEPTNFSLMGCLAARVAVDALMRAGPRPTPETVAAALRKTKVDFGGYSIDLTGGQVGSRMVDIAVIDRAGSLRF